MFSFMLVLLSILGQLVSAQIGDFIMQDLGLEVQENDVSTTIIVSSMSSQIMMAGSLYTSFPTLTIPAPDLNTSRSLTHSLPGTAIIPLSAPTASAGSIKLGRTLSNTTIAEWDAGHGTTGSLTCQNCTTFGDFYFTTNGFREISNTSSNMDQYEELQHGSFLARFQGAGGSMNFRLTASGTLSHNVVFLDVPTPLGYVIPGLGTVGLTLAVAIPIAMELPAPVDVTFGFSYTLPDDAFINVTLGTLEDSHAYGFTIEEGLQLHLLPFNFDTINVDISLSTSVQTSLNLGFTFLNDNVFASAGIFIDTPGLSIDANQVSTCKKINNNDTVISAIRPSLFFNNATEISPAIGIDVGVSAKLGIHGFHTFDQATKLVKTSLDLLKTCLPNPPVTGLPSFGLPLLSGAETRLSTVVVGPASAIPFSHLVATSARLTGSTSLNSSTMPTFLPPPPPFSTPAPSSFAQSTPAATIQDSHTTTPPTFLTTSAPPPSSSVYVGLAGHDMSPMALVLLPFMYWVLSAVVDLC